ncbi:unnamed protein product [Medioppia subpectinata]|uniref:BTB domain-containing protein n=1 Tax=Medioppia subpectinata TaxID=1979941 RepID=A0A7R9KQ03_9ACAR|nr:unnamed protein product [Medioppia subpectinata]CAG2107659.1 unnamed protein product [Medioppia subpectinata]
MHTWMATVGTAHGMRLDAIPEQLLQDFSHLWSDDCTVQFVDECLPLLFTIFRHHILCTIKVMQFLYNGGFETDTDVDQNNILELMSIASYFQLDGLLRYCSRRCCDCVDTDSVVELYMNAIQYNALELMQFCQQYMLENLVALLEHDPQLSQLLFARQPSSNSKLLFNNKPDHLSALLFTLQQRCRDRQQLALQKQQAQMGAKNQFLR